VALKGDEALLRREDFYAIADNIFDRILSLASLSPNEKTCSLWVAGPIP
jgi:hypothetical protein